MIKLGSKIELERLEVELDKEVREKVEEVLIILDEEYGEERNIIKDLGGFVALVEDITDIKELEGFNLNLKKDVVEDIELIETETRTYLSILNLVGSDFAIVIIVERSDIEEDLLKKWGV